MNNLQIWEKINELHERGDFTGVLQLLEQLELEVLENLSENMESTPSSGSLMSLASKNSKNPLIKDYCDLLHYKVQLFCEFGREEDALETLERLLTLDPDDVQSWNLLLEVALNLGRDDLVTRAWHEIRSLGRSIKPSISSFRQVQSLSSHDSNGGNSSFDLAPSMKKASALKEQSRENSSTLGQQDFLSKSSFSITQNEMTNLVFSSSDDDNVIFLTDEQAATARTLVVNDVREGSLMVSKSVKEFIRLLGKNTTNVEILLKVKDCPRSSESLALHPLSVLKSDLLENALGDLGFKGLYPFQLEAFEFISEGDDVLISAPTGAGKTEAALLPIIKVLCEGLKEKEKKKSSTLQKSAVKVLIIYPTKALSRDQMEKIRRLAVRLSFTVDTLDGDTPFTKRSRFFKNPPDILITNLDMLHYHLVRTPRFIKLFSDLRFLVIDELHLYGGMRGGILHGIIWRLRRYSSFRRKVSPLQVIGMSATIANPQDFFRQLLGEKKRSSRARRVVLADDRTAPYPSRIFFVLRPRTGVKWDHFILMIVALSVQAGVKMLVFMDSRMEVERIHDEFSRLYPELASRVGIHRAGLTPSERELMERRFKLPLSRSEALSCLICTSTLEVGIDVGDVEVVLTTPNDPDRLWQRVGRGGRKGQVALALIAIPPHNPISRFLTQEPVLLFRPLIPLKPFVDDAHLRFIHVIAAARDAPLSEEEIKEWRHIVYQAVKKGYLMRNMEGKHHITKQGRSYLRHVPLITVNEVLEVRTIDNVSSKERDYLKRRLKSTTLGDLDQVVMEYYDRLAILTSRALPRALNEFYPGAIYIHAGLRYEILGVNLRANPPFALACPLEAIVHPAMDVEGDENDVLNPEEDEDDSLIETKPVIVRIISRLDLLEDFSFFSQHSFDGSLKSDVFPSWLKNLPVTVQNVRVNLKTMVVGYRKIRRHVDRMETKLPSHDIDVNVTRLDPPLVHVEKVEGVILQLPLLSSIEILNAMLINQRRIRYPSIQDSLDEMAAMGYHALIHLVRHAIVVILGLKEEDFELLSIGDAGLVFLYSSKSSGVTKCILEQLEVIFRVALEIAVTCRCTKITTFFQPMRGQEVASKHSDSSSLVSVSGCPLCTFYRGCSHDNGFLNKILAVRILEKINENEKDHQNFPKMDVSLVKGKIYV